MSGRSDSASPAREETPTAGVDRLYQEGIVAGLLGAATIALWFLILDTVRGRPLYTPTILGTTLFRRGEGLGSLETLRVSPEMVLMYSFVHTLVFCVLGGIASRLLALAEERPNLGFGIVLLFVVFEFGFILTAMVVAEPILRALTWPAILLGNLLAALVMGAYLWRRHPNLTIWP